MDPTPDATAEGQGEDDAVVEAILDETLAAIRGVRAGSTDHPGERRRARTVIEAIVAVEGIAT